MNIVRRQISPNIVPPNWESSQKEIYCNISRNVHSCKRLCSEETLPTLKNHKRTCYLLLFKIGITIKGLRNEMTSQKWYFPLHRLGHFLGSVRYRSSHWLHSDSPTLLTARVDFASWTQIHAQCDLSHIICLVVFHTAMKIKCGAFYLKLLKKS